MYTALVLALLLHIILCQNNLKPIFQPLNDSHMMMLFNNTLVAKMNHISKVTLKMKTENINLAEASIMKTETLQDKVEITFQPLDINKGLMVKMDSCSALEKLYLVVECIVGSPSNGNSFHYVPLDYIKDDLDTWICKQDDTTIWMNTAGFTILP